MPTPPPAWHPTVDRLDVVQLNAVGDNNPASAGWNDVAFQRAFDIVGRTGGAVHVPPGKYHINRMLTMPPGVQLIGEGGGEGGPSPSPIGSHLIFHGGPGPCIRLGTDMIAYGAHDNTISNLSIQGALDAGGMPVAGTLIQILGAGNRVTIWNCLLQHSARWGVEALGNTPASGIESLRVQDCHIYACLEGGIRVMKGVAYIGQVVCNNGYLTAKVGRPIGKGIWSDDASVMHVINADSLAWEQALLFTSARPIAKDQGLFSTVEASSFDSSGYGVMIGDPTGSPVHDVQISDCWMGSCSYGIVVQNADGVQIEGCEVVNNGGYGIDLRAPLARNITVSNNTIVGNNTSQQNLYGIVLEDGIDYIIIQGNRIGEVSGNWRGTQWGGLGVFGSPCTNVVVANNIIATEQLGNPALAFVTNGGCGNGLRRVNTGNTVNGVPFGASTF